jgi:hypothetical protein
MGATGPSGIAGGTSRFGVTVPTSSLGAVGDLAGDMAVTSGYVYICKTNYTTGSVDIWIRVAVADTTF